MNSIILLLKILTILLGCFVLLSITKKKLTHRNQVFLCLILLWIGYFCSGLASTVPEVKEEIKLTGLGTKNELSQWYQVILSGYSEGNMECNFSSNERISGVWIEQEKEVNSVAKRYIWVPTDDDIWQEGITDTITIAIPAGSDRTLIFDANIYGGQVRLEYQGESLLVDTYAEEFTQIQYSLMDSPKSVLQQNTFLHFAAFVGTFTILCSIYCFLVLIATRGKNFQKIKRYKFLFEELVKRDFTQKYKRTVLGVLWSILSPLINLLIMWLVFSQMLGSNMEHYVIYLFSGQMLFTYFNDSTTQGMTSLLDNAPIFTKVNVPKYMFLLSKNISTFINFGLTLIIFFAFVLLDGIQFDWNYLMLIYPLGCLILLNLGMGMVLSALFVFFRDMQYLWGVATQLIMWVSAIFYSVKTFPQNMQNFFLINPIYQIILYFRTIIIDGGIPDIGLHFVMGAYSILFILLGCFFYKKYNHEFLYYV